MTAELRRGTSLTRKIVLTALVIVNFALLQWAPSQFHWLTYVLGVVIIVGVLIPPLNRTRDQ